MAFSARARNSKNIVSHDVRVAEDPAQRCAAEPGLQHVVDLRMNLYPGAQRLGLRIKPRSGQHLLLIMEARTGERETDPVLVVHTVIEGLIQLPPPLHHGASEEYGGLAEKAGLRKPGRAPGLRRVGLDDLIRYVDMIGAPVYHVERRVGLKAGGYRAQRSRVIHVVGIQPSENLPGAGAQALVYGVRLPIVFL